MSWRSVIPINNLSGKSADDLFEEHIAFLREKSVGPHVYDLNNGRVISCSYTRTEDSRWLATYEDVTDRRQAEAKIMHMARHDALTNLPNRVLFRDKMDQALRRGERLAVMFLDLDRFKGVNDSLGHSVGDALLCAVTERLQRVVRGVDTVARLGGDEFAIVQSQARPSDASELAAKVIETLLEPFEVHGHQVIIGTSIGIAMAPTDGSDPDQLLRNADMALYRAKANGRGNYHFFQSGDGCADAGAPAARTRSAQGVDRRRIRAVLPAARSNRERRGVRLRGADPLESSRARHRRPRRISSRSPKRSG